MSAIDATLAHDMTVGNLVEAYDLPFDEAEAGVLRFTVASAGVT